MNKLDSLPQVLFTTELSYKQKQVMESPNYHFQSTPFITADYPDAEKWKSQIPEKYDALVFTSKRSVKAIKAHIQSFHIPKYVFAVGEKTSEELEGLKIIPIIPEEYNLKSLAEKMNAFDLSNIIHFCGNRRSGDLSELLKDPNVTVNAIEVYSTHLNPQVIDTAKFNGFVFMSPSAVKAFHQKNHLPDHVAVFAIGPSTANALNNHGVDQFIQAQKATVESLAESINKYFTNVLS